MKNSNQYINNAVYNTNLKYVKLQNETEKLFFRCLDEEQDEEYFEKELKKIWENADISSFKKEIDEYKEIIHENNFEASGLKKQPYKEEKNYVKLVETAVIVSLTSKLIKQKEKEYKVSINSKAYKTDKKEYLSKKVAQYNDAIVPYYSKNGGIARYVQLSTYASMIHNTNLTRSAWNVTLNDAGVLGVKEFYIPYHSFSCSYCAGYQGTIMTDEEVINELNIDAEEQAGEILHPNCKCVLLPYYDNLTEIRQSPFTEEEEEEIYHTRQKVNSLTLKKENINTKIQIYDKMGDFKNVDKYKSQRNKINSQIRELRDSLPTKELQKQVTAINR